MIPAFNLSGVLPPYLGGDPTHPAGVSPYDTTATELVETLGTSADRAAILRGFLSLRAALARIGITDGYQWCAGSFCEDIERLENRNPGDIDIVTLFLRPPSLAAPAQWSAFVSANAALFDPVRTKASYKCDAYFIDGNVPFQKIVPQVTYWYGLFGHRRVSHTWKGLLRVPLVSDDQDALNHLDRVWP